MVSTYCARKSQKRSQNPRTLKCDIYCARLVAQVVSMRSFSSKVLHHRSTYAFGRSIEVYITCRQCRQPDSAALVENLISSEVQFKNRTKSFFILYQKLAKKKSLLLILHLFYGRSQKWSAGNSVVAKIKRWYTVFLQQICACIAFLSDWVIY